MRWRSLPAPTWPTSSAPATPNGEGLPVWPEGDADHGYMVLDVEPHGVTGWTELDALMRTVVIENFDINLN